MTRFTRLIAGAGIAAAAAGSSVAIARSHPHRDGVQERHFDRFVRDLNLDAAQKSRAEAIHDRMVTERIGLDGKTRLAEHELRKLIRSEAPDRAELLARVDEVGRLRTELRKIRIAARLDQRDLLTTAQREKLRELIERRHQQRAERDGNHGRPNRHQRFDDDEEEDDGDRNDPPSPEAGER